MIFLRFNPHLSQQGQRVEGRVEVRHVAGRLPEERLQLSRLVHDLLGRLPPVLAVLERDSPPHQVRLQHRRDVPARRNLETLPFEGFDLEGSEEN